VDDLHRHFAPTQAKTDASACAWIAVDTKTAPRSDGIGPQKFLAAAPQPIFCEISKPVIENDICEFESSQPSQLPSL
jgi:hypothetical protein